MKFKRKKNRKNRMSVERRYKANRICGILVWAILLVYGVSAIFAYAFTLGNSRDTFLLKRFSDAVQRNVDVAITEKTVGRDAFVGGVTAMVSFANGFRVGDIYLTEERLMEYPKQLDVNQLSDTANQLNDFYRSYQVPMCVIAVPSASEFYGTELLNGLTVPSQASFIDTFYQQFDSSIRKIDVYHVLYTMTDSYIYNRTDSRWTGYGAYCVYCVAIQKMGFAPVSYDQYIVQHTGTFRGKLYESCLYQSVAADTIDIYTCSSGAEETEILAYLADGTVEERHLYQETETEDPAAYYLGESCEKIVIQTDLESQRKLLVLKDSYADCIVPFFLQHYSEICVINVTEMQHPLSELIDVSEYSQILVLCDADTFSDVRNFYYICD